MPTGAVDRAYTSEQPPDSPPPIPPPRSLHHYHSTIKAQRSNGASVCATDFFFALLVLQLTVADANIAF
ncbi:hypothetical protein V1477_000376 [Vespula maculifrons]|uniref:Uncharacterized protein n=4 Tax=Vespula TaxID=7451 RepID=A0A834KHE8_VESPE|nr:hypothetical protein HZH66_012128 [Vespula vulgaris]KAF7406791.1 hypothetical protein H0235_014447 [Vespula pensylvanica]